jgi:uncharacterized membrane protein
MLDGILWDWLSFAVRWLHVIAGIAWIGSSFYFIALDLSLQKREGLPPGAGGEAWQVHGGGFYNMVKFLVAPARMPEQLTWFKWEAYTTWLSGFFLLVIVYYAGAEMYLVDNAVRELSPWAAVGIGLASLALGWLVYDLLCRSPLGRNTALLVALGFVFLVFVGWLLTKFLSGRGAYVHVGALIGSIMVGNVFFVIIPNQKIVVADLKAGRTPDPELGRVAKQRSLHNNYLTLPVIFVMISGHYPLSFATKWNWVILALVIAIGGVIRHFFNERHRGAPSPWWTWVVAALGFALMVWLSYAGAPGARAAAAKPVSEARIVEILQTRCLMCHAQKPLWPGMAMPPNHIRLESAADARRQARLIYEQAALTHAMPPNNLSFITDEERAEIAAWYRARRAAQ